MNATNAATTTLPEFIAREGIAVKEWHTAQPSGQWMRRAFSITLARTGGKELHIPRWGHGGALGTPPEELASVVSSLITDAQVSEDCGDSITKYESNFGPAIAGEGWEDRQANKREIRRILTACKKSRADLRRWLGPKLYQELLYEVEGY